MDELDEGEKVGSRSGGRRSEKQRRWSEAEHEVDGRDASARRAAMP
jgi:hypothetical protein